MPGSEMEMQSIIEKVVREVFKNMGMETEKEEKALAVLPGYLFDATGVAQYLKENYKNVTCALFEDTGLKDAFNAIKIDTKEDKRKLAEELKEYKSVVLITPPMQLLALIASGDDTEFASMLMIRPLLWGRDVSILLDFEAPKFKRSTAFEKISDNLNAIEAMGIRIIPILQKILADDEPKDLVTEQDIKDASRDEKKRVRIKPNAIITQLAADTAKELGITIESRG